MESMNIQGIDKGFIKRIMTMDYDALVFEIAHHDLLIEFTKKRIGSAPNIDKTMEKQLERLIVEKEFITKWKKTMAPPIKKKKNVTKRRKNRKN